jgi:hypothetical protein
MNKQRKTSNILNVFQYDESTGAVTLPSTLDLTAPGSSDDSTKAPTTAWVRALISSLGYVTLSTEQTITGLKTIVRSGDVLNFKIGADNLYALKIVYNQNELVGSGEATWSFENTFNNGIGTGITTTPISFFRGVLVTGQRLLSASVNANLLDYYGNNPSGRYPVYAYNTGVQQFASGVIVGDTTGVVNAATGAIADLPAGVVANFKGRVIGSNAVNNNEFVTLSQLTTSSGAYLLLTGGTLTGALNGTSGVFSGGLTVTSASSTGMVVNSTNGASFRGFTIQANGTTQGGIEILPNTGEIRIGGYSTTSDYFPVIYSDGVAALTFGIGASPSATFSSSVTSVGGIINGSDFRYAPLGNTNGNPVLVLKNPSSGVLSLASEIIGTAFVNSNSLALSVSNTTNGRFNALTIASTGAATFSSSITVTTTGTFGFQDYRTQATQKVLVLNAEGVSGNYAPALFNVYTKPGTTVNGIASLIITSKYGSEAESGNLFEFKGNGESVFSNTIVSSEGYQGRYYRILEASANRGGLYPFNLVFGGGTDYSLGIFSEGEIFLAPGGSATKRFTMNNAGAATFTNSVTASSFSTSGFVKSNGITKTFNVQKNLNERLSNVDYFRVQSTFGGGFQVIVYTFSQSTGIGWFGSQIFQAVNTPYWGGWIGSSANVNQIGGESGVISSAVIGGDGSITFRVSTGNNGTNTQSTINSFIQVSAFNVDGIVVTTL